MVDTGGRGHTEQDGVQTEDGLVRSGESMVWGYAEGAPEEPVWG